MAVNKKHEATQDDLDYFEYAIKEQAPKKEELPWWKSIPAALLKGFIEGTISFGEAMSVEIKDPQEYEKGTQQRKAYLKEKLPSNEGFIEGVLEKGLKVFPLAATSGSGLLSAILRSLTAGVAEETAKQVGAPEWAQNIAGAAPFVLPDLAKKIPTLLGKQTELAEYARKVGMPEKELSLLLNQKGLAREFAEDISSKGGKTVKAFDATKNQLRRVWETLRASPEAQQPMTGEQSAKLINNMSERLSKLPSESTERIAKDFNIFLGSQMKGEDVINFWQKLNYYIAKGEGNLGVLKKDLQIALNEISPQLGKDFQLTNELYGNFHKLAEKMGPNITEHLIRAGEQGIILTAITTGNYPLFKKILGPVAGRLMSREMIINSRFQNLSLRFLNAIKQSSIPLAKKVYSQMLLEVGKTNAEAAMKMSGMDMDKFFESLDEPIDESNDPIQQLQSLPSQGEDMKKLTEEYINSLEAKRYQPQKQMRNIT